MPPLLVAGITGTLLAAELKRHGVAALVPSPFWGWLGLWGVWGAAITAIKLKQPWMWLVQLLAMIFNTSQKVPLHAVVVMLLLAMVPGLVVALIKKVGLFDRRRV